MLQEFDVNLDLTEILSLKKSEILQSRLKFIEHIQVYKYY